MDRYLKRHIFLLGISLMLMSLPFLVGFPDERDGSYYLSRPGSMTSISLDAFMFAQVEYLLMAAGVIISAISTEKIQKYIHVKPTLIMVQMDSKYFKVIWSGIKESLAIKIIFLANLLIFIIVMFGIL